MTLGRSITLQNGTGAAAGGGLAPPGAWAHVLDIHLDGTVTVELEDWPGSYFGPVQAVGGAPVEGARCFLGCDQFGEPSFAVVEGLGHEPDEDQTPYTHIQASPAAVWTVVHGLGRHPSVTVVDTTGKQLLVAVSYVDVNTVVVRFGSATAGAAYLN